MSFAIKKYFQKPCEKQHQGIDEVLHPIPHSWVNHVHFNAINCVGKKSNQNVFKIHICPTITTY
jgi:hypothetical protein